MTTCTKTAREGRWLLTCVLADGHVGDCWCADITDEDTE